MAYFRREKGGPVHSSKRQLKKAIKRRFGIKTGRQLRKQWSKIQDQLIQIEEKKNDQG